jgi:tripartite-type tricarboxylate transporter receptor subunit TctC
VNRRDCMRLGAAAIAARFFPDNAALAQAKYPQETIRLIVPYAPGGVVDAVARNWAERMRGPIGTVIVENEGGGGGPTAIRSCSAIPARRSSRRI